MNTKVP